jgi:hypothetical protein
MVPSFGTIRADDVGSCNRTGYAMSITTSCFEIVHFAFLEHVPLTRQTELMKLLGDWAAAQGGFISRQSFHDRQSNRWTDVVEWNSLPEAQAAMAASQQEPKLAAVMDAIAPEPLSMGHYERLG